MIEAAGRHVSLQTLEDYVAAGVPASIPIVGEPQAVLTVDAANETLRLEVGWDGEQPPTIDDYVHISTDVRFHRGRNWAVIAVHGRRFFAEAYPLLRAVADLVQLEATPFDVAVSRSLASYHELLTSRSPMPVRDEIGLFGELYVLSHLIDEIGPDRALAAWRGGDEAEEHDLGLADDDVEIKTTTAEARRHWIGSLTQLQPTVGRPLWLLSIQLTAAGASDGRRLPDLISDVAHQLPPSLRQVFNRRIAGTRYRAGQPHDTFRLLRPRSAPACFRVDEDFPRLDRGVLTAGGADVEHIGDVTYTIRLDGRPSSAEPPRPLRGLLRKDV